MYECRNVKDVNTRKIFEMFLGQPLQISISIIMDL